MDWLKKHPPTVFLILFAVLAFSFYSYFNLLVASPQDDFFNRADSPKFSSPDETANYFWITQFAKGQPLYYFEELNGLGTNLIHPRSMNTLQGKITPGSFLGMTLIYGSLAKIFGTPIVPYLTPLFSVLGLIFFYLLIKHLFHSRHIALISTALLSFFPAWFYYSARGMYHNILFLSLFMIGAFILFKSFQLKKPALINPLYLLSGFLIGLSIITRTAEVVWLAATILILFIINFKRIHWPGFILFLSGLWLPALFLLYHNQILYGAFISAGYRAVVPAGGLVEAIRTGILFQILVTPFGFDIKSILISAYNYLYNFLPYWSAPAVIGGFLFAVLPNSMINISYKKRIVYLIYFALTTVYLLIFYGSWRITDRIDNQTLSLGTSYLRYWLPIYLLSLPFIATLIWYFAKFITSFRLKLKSTYQVLISLMLIVLLLMPSINLVFRATDESLFLLKNLSTARIKSTLINKVISQDDITVIYKQADKIFFPERRKIITELVVPADYAAVANLARFRNVYFYTFAPPDFVEFISGRDFEPHGLTIHSGQQVLGTDWLYRISLIQ